MKMNNTARVIARSSAALAAASLVGISAAGAASAATTPSHTSPAHVVKAASNFNVLALLNIPK